MKFHFTTLAGMSAALLLALFSCRSNRSGNTEVASTVIEAEKPAIDSSKIIELVDLYRATRYEDLQSALAAGPESVHKISFHGRKMGSVPPEIASFKYLATLDVAHNDLQDLPDEISSMHYLQGFYANGNNLREFPGQIFLLPLLDRLNLSENQITTIPAEIMRMDQLSSLNLEKNLLTKIPVQIYELNKLTVLNLSGNGLTILPGGISRLSVLRKLDLSNNQLAGVPKEITTMGSHLTELMLHGNRIPREEIQWLIEAMPATKIRF